MEIKWLRLNFGVYDYCPVCKERVSVEWAGLEVQEFPKSVRFLCIDHGAWEVPISMEDFLGRNDITG